MAETTRKGPAATRRPRSKQSEGKTQEGAQSTQRLVDFTEIDASGEDWEAFARDFFVAEGFAIESPPDRGADGGKDLLISEQISGTYSSYPFRWLVSCKHFALSGKAVSPKDELNLLERLAAFGAQGFIGFYSTTLTAGLGTQLRSLRDGRHMRDYRIFDGRLIENHLVRIGYSRLLLRYFPKGYRAIKPIHKLKENYEPLNCATCGEDILEQLHLRTYNALIGIARKHNDGEEHILHVYWACKGRCDLSEAARWRKLGCIVGWEDISDLVIPRWYLRWCLTVMTRLRDGSDTYEDQAYDQMKYFISALGQRVFREMTDEETDRVKRLFTIPMF